MAYALYRNGVRVRGPHSTRAAVCIEALEAHAVVTAGPGDFIGDPDHGMSLVDGYEIRKIEDG